MVSRFTSLTISGCNIPSRSREPEQDQQRFSTFSVLFPIQVHRRVRKPPRLSLSARSSPSMGSADFQPAQRARVPELERGPVQARERYRRNRERPQSCQKRSWKCARLLIVSSIEGAGESGLPPASATSGLRVVLRPTPPNPPPSAPGILPSAVAPGLSIPPPIVPILPVPKPWKAVPPIRPGVATFSPIAVAPIVLLEAGPPTIAGSLGRALAA